MIPVKGIDAISKNVFQKYKHEDCITFGILVADYRQDEARQYIINYLDMFDQKSGKCIDFFVPGYYQYSDSSVADYARQYHPNMEVRCGSWYLTPTFSRNSKKYCFDQIVFEDFLRDLEYKMGIKYTYNPMLILVEVKKGRYREQIEFQDRIVIELDDDTPRGLRRSGELFDAIFDFAKKEVGLDRYGEMVRVYYIKGNAVNRIARALEGDWIEGVTETLGGVIKYRIKSRS